MWWYIPETSSQAGAVSADSTEASTWRSELLAQFVTSSGKFQRSQSWLRAWKRATYIRLLFGQIQEPSTAQRGADAFVASLEAHPASHSQSQGSGSNQQTNGTAGPMQSESFVTPDPAGPSSRMFQALTGTWLSPSSLTLKNLVTQSRRASSRRRKLAHPTGGSGSSSWPTPDTVPEAPNQNSLKWASKDQPGFIPPGLGNAAMHWATPWANDYKEGAAADNLAPTNGYLGRQAPRTPMPGPESSQQGHTSHQQWPTIRTGKSDKLESHHDSATPIGLRLNPEFVLWLMNFPEGWLDLLDQQS